MTCHTTLKNPCRPSFVSSHPSVRSDGTKSPNVVGARLPCDAIEAHTQLPGPGHVNGLGKWYIKVHAMGLGNRKGLLETAKIGMLLFQTGDTDLISTKSADAAASRQSTSDAWGAPVSMQWIPTAASASVGPIWGRGLTRGTVARTQTVLLGTQSSWHGSPRSRVLLDQGAG